MEVIKAIEDWARLGISAKIAEALLIKFPDKWLGRLPESIISEEMLEIVHVQTLFFQQYNIKLSEDDVEKFRVMMIKEILSTVRGYNSGY